MNDRIDDVIAARLAAAASSADDSDWLDVRRRARRNALRRRRVPLAAAALVLAGGVTALLGVLPAGDESTPGMLGLDAVAAIAATAPSTVPAPGEYVYDRQRYEIHGRTCTQEWWVAADGSGRFHQRGEVCQLPSDERWGPPRPKRGPWPSGDGLDIRFGRREAPEVYDAMTGSSVNAWLDDDLPTDPETLERALHRRLLKMSDFGPGGHVPSGMLSVIGQLLANPLASPELRSALYRVAGALDGVEIKERVTDPAGRVGTAISAGYDPLAKLRPKVRKRQANLYKGWVLIFDPATSTMLASGQISSRTEINFHVYLTRQTVTSLHDRP